MRIAFLCKRRYMGKDVIADRYGRLYELPWQLALLGHDVQGLCLSYRPVEALDVVDTAAADRLRWRSPATGAARLPDLIGYPRAALAVLRAFRPDVIVGASDALHVALARWLAGRLGVPYAIDLYDNFESFGLTRIPGLRRAYRRAIGGAVMVSCTGNALAAYVRQTCAPRGRVIALPSTVDRMVFLRGDKASARRELGLPDDAVLIGTAGGLLADRGIGTLYEAFHHLMSSDERLHLVLAGPVDRTCPPPTQARVHYLGLLPHARVAALFRALDVGVIYLRDTPFGRYCFPQKAYEMLACGLPLAAANVGEMPHLLASAPQSLYAVDDAASLAATIRAQLANPQLPSIEFGDWRALASDFDAALQAALSPSPLTGER
jgi:glycosyltransferase involved in cell wall biosynthesis